MFSGCQYPILPGYPLERDQGKRPRGRPKTTWRRTIESELKELDMTWGEAETKAKYRTGWRDLEATLCSDGSEEDR